MPSIHMPSIHSMIVATFMVLLTASSTDVLAQDDKRQSDSDRQESNQAQGVAVVELFTSQGCSSCPPADAALRQIDEVANKNELPVYALSFHVDYWNRLGWKDPYSDVAYSQRQRAYAQAMDRNRVYTPQMIVNGKTEFVGSNKKKAHTAITQSLKQTAAAKIDLQAIDSASGDRVSVAYDAQETLRGDVLNVALVYTPAANDVPKGENAGRSLEHVNVVRDFKTVMLDETSGRVELALPDDVDRSDVSVIAYVQNRQSLQIRGAARMGMDSK